VKLYETVGDGEDISRLEVEVKKTVNRLGEYVEIVVDRIGVGAGLLSSLKAQGYRARGCAFGEKADDKEAFNNKKIELYWRFRESLRLGEVAIAPLGEGEETVFEELMAIRYNTNTEKQIICEPKEKVRSRIGRSPDAADSVVLGMQVKPFFQHQAEPIVVISGQHDEEFGYQSGRDINFGWSGGSDDFDFPS
jgi:hypothetical protein